MLFPYLSYDDNDLLSMYQAQRAAAFSRHRRSGRSAVGAVSDSGGSLGADLPVSREGRQEFGKGKLMSQKAEVFVQPSQRPALRYRKSRWNQP